ncbi:hypothetical protein M8818_007503 [Zalaria obscura]|uniref:Uncharacterized protein n=1 Tax=Zalaria obscura TaxID=2024903 RepID=A0ACC3S3F2_9PEZI
MTLTGGSACWLPLMAFSKPQSGRVWSRPVGMGWHNVPPRISFSQLLRGILEVAHLKFGTGANVTTALDLKSTSMRHKGHSTRVQERVALSARACCLDIFTLIHIVRIVPHDSLAHAFAKLIWASTLTPISPPSLWSNHRAALRQAIATVLCFHDLCSVALTLRSLTTQLPWSTMNQEAPSSSKQQFEQTASKGYVSSESERAQPAGSAKKRPSRAGTRSVNTLSAAQLERKRANDREAQRAIRQRTKDHIETLERRITELSVSQDAHEKVLAATQQRNRELEEENAYLKGRLGGQYLTSSTNRTAGQSSTSKPCSASFRPLRSLRAMGYLLTNSQQNKA